MTAEPHDCDRKTNHVSSHLASPDRSEPSPARRPSFTLLLPVYNEAATLRRSLDTLHSHIGGLADRYEGKVLIVDDGSSDGSADIAESFAAGKPDVRVIRHHRNFRLGQALRFAIPQCTTDYIVTFDADLSYGPDHIDRLLDTIVETRAKVVVASPYMAGGTVTGVPRGRLLTSRAANRFLSLVSKSSVHTVTGLVRAYDRRFLEILNLKAMDNEINAEILYKAEVMRAHIIEIPAHLDWTSLQDRRPTGLRISRTTAGFAFSGFLFRPFMFFILPGLVLLAASVVAGILFLAGWSTPATGWMAALGLILSMQLVTGGVVSAQVKRYYEELFHASMSIRRGLRHLDPDALRPGATAENGQLRQRYGSSNR